MKKKSIALILLLCCVFIGLSAAYVSKNKKSLAYEKNQVIDQLVSAKNAAVDWLTGAKDTAIDIFTGESGSKAP